MSVDARKTWLWLIPLLLVTFWIGVHYVNVRSIWEDESYSLRDAGIGVRSLTDIWTGVATRNPWHPPGFFIVLNTWGQVVGATVAPLRLLSLLFGLLTVAFTYRLGYDTVSERVGLYGAVLLGTTVMFAYYNDQIRVYTLLALLTTLTLWLYLRIVRMKSEPRRLDWFCLLLVVAGVLYSHYFGGIILGIIGLYHLIFVPKNRRWWAVIGIFALGGALFLPWVGVLIEALRRFVRPQAYNERAFNDGELITTIATIFSNGTVALLIVAIIPALLSRPRGGWRLWFFAGTVLIILLVINALFPVISMSRLRYLLMLWPLFALIVAMGIVWLGQRSRVGQVASLALLLLWAGVGIANVSNLDLTSGLGGGASLFPFQRLIQVQKPQSLVNDLTVSYLPQNTPFTLVVSEYYASQFPTDTVIVTSSTHGKPDIDEKKLAKHDRLWVAYVPNLPIDEQASFHKLQSVLSTYTQCRKPVDTPELSITLYAQISVCCDTNDPPVARFGNDLIQLTSTEVLPRQGDRQPLAIGWRLSTNVPPDVYSVTLQVFDQAGNKVGQKDYGLKVQPYLCPRADIDVSGLKPGSYEVHAGVYDWKTQVRLPAIDATGQQRDLIPVGTFQVS